MCSIFLLANLITSAIDLLLNHRYTWFLLVGTSLFFFWAFLDVLLFSKNNRILRSASLFSIMLIPYFVIIENVSNQFLLDKPVYWSFTIGVPIAGIWISYFWILLGVKYILRLNIGLCIGSAFVLSVPAVLFTNNVANQNNFFGFDGINPIVAIILLSVGIVSIILGIFFYFQNLYYSDKRRHH
ncbi:hypothetical protein IGI67_003325 [Enterococcus sp. AZ196]